MAVWIARLRSDARNVCGCGAASFSPPFFGRRAFSSSLPPFGNSDSRAAVCAAIASTSRRASSAHASASASHRAMTCLAKGSSSASVLRQRSKKTRCASTATAICLLNATRFRESASCRRDMSPNLAASCSRRALVMSTSASFSVSGLASLVSFRKFARARSCSAEHRSNRRFASVASRRSTETIVSRRAQRSVSTAERSAPRASAMSRNAPSRRSISDAPTWAPNGSSSGP